jgi:signal transduction histidine kinase
MLRAARDELAKLERWVERVPLAPGEDVRNAVTIQVLALVALAFTLAQEASTFVTIGWHRELLVNSALNLAAVPMLVVTIALIRQKGLRAGLRYAVSISVFLQATAASLEGLQAADRYLINFGLILAVAALGLSRRALVISLAFQLAGLWIGAGVDNGLLWRPFGGLEKNFNVVEATFALLLSGIILNRFGTALREALDKALAELELRRLADERLRLSDERLRLLDDAGSVLNRSMEYEKTISEVLGLMVTRLADWCLIDLVTEGHIARVAARHRDPKKQPLLDELFQKYPLDWNAPEPTARVLKTGSPLFLPKVTDEMVRGFTRDERHREIIAALGSRTSVVMPLEARGRVIGVVSITRGDADRPYTEEDLSLVQELARRAAVAIDRARLFREAQAATRLREDLVTVTAHELNTPVTVLLSMLQQLERTGAVGSPPEHSIRLIGKQARRLGETIEKLLTSLDIARAELTPRLEQIDLSGLTKETLEDLRLDWEDKVRQVSLDAPAPVLGLWDSRFLRQIIASLLSNAFKFGNDGPIEVKVVMKEKAVLEVVDHGIGIPADQLPHVFERFGRGVPTQHYGGFGLGLYLVHGLTVALGGAVHAESEPGKGATFRIELPCHSESHGPRTT